MGRASYQLAIKAEAVLYGFKKQQIDIGEMKIHFYQNQFLQRETIVMLHGFSADKDVWLRFARFFSKKYNVIIPDMAGHGETGFSKNWNYDAKSQLNRLSLLLDKLNVEKAHVIGNSMGGFFAAQFAKDYSNRVISAALIDPAGLSSSNKSDMDKMLVKGKNPFIIGSREEFDYFYAMTMARPPWFPSFIHQYIYEKYKSQQAQLSQMFKAFFYDEKLDEHLPEISSPVLLLWGEKDRLIDVSDVDRWQAGVKNIQTKTWPDIGHMPMLEIPRESAQVYNSFLQNLTHN